MESKPRTVVVAVLLGLTSLPLVVMLISLLLDTFTTTQPGSLVPNSFTLEHWRFLWSILPGRPSIWIALLNTIVFAGCSTLLLLAVSSTAGYALARLNVPFRKFFLAGVLVMHAFPTVTLIIAIFLILQVVGLYNHIGGVILAKTALDLPLGIWIMKGFYDTVPWEIEMAGVQDGASRFTVWRKLVLPQIKPGLMALGIFSVISGWSEYILPQVLAPRNDVQVLSVYLAALVNDDTHFDFHLFKAVGLFYALPVFLIYLFFQDKLMTIYGGGTKG
ncbi:carbohydrate ABC transporter membrane protein 2, CUT1 family [Rhizobiales bacterium GAS191]|nr:carbohydrate ABC transporter membrane protein 2, CUT1 family [Rhizobiales bacterium GAS188]SEE50277.1 carbohydrate ABC transporter membrane protein 2, CUT1 family [Rhizobiales bacterium GAS191]